MYTPHYAASTGTDDSGVEVRIEMKRPTLVLPGPAMALGTIVRIRDLQGDTPLLFNQIVLSAAGVARDALLSKVAARRRDRHLAGDQQLRQLTADQLVEDLRRHRRRLPFPDRRRADHRSQQPGRERAQLAHGHRLQRQLRLLHRHRRLERRVSARASASSSWAILPATRSEPATRSRWIAAARPPW